jgi:soluble P-type ATPase
MKNFINSPQKKGFIDEECKDLSMTGLRTLVFSRKVIKEDVYENWSKRYE